ncbi:MAG: RNA methyltransferase [Crocinitomicaceae bacterium TMED209]|nr:MAG: RNA methyltransferase [Crocinitomicaceae bacterium TMED209]|tara:strand:+ start:168 stop:914 length:747 start_codon:yes stop_codon:yes gene_type:complete
MQKKNNYYWMYSRHAIESALLNPKRNILEILVEDKLSEYYKNYFKFNNINKNILFNTANKSRIIKKIGRLAKYQGVALLVEKLAYEKDFLLDSSFQNNNFILIVDQLNDALNFGALLRVSYAFNVKFIITLDRSVPEENSYIASAASGALDKINIYKVKNITNSIKALKQKNWWIIGLESKKLKKCINIKEHNNLFKKKALIIGSENKGLRNLVRNNCDILYRICPKNEDLDSINVVQAASIALYELT